MQLEDNNSTALHWQWSHSATSSSVGDSSNLMQGAEIAPGEIAMLKAKMGALGSQLSTLQQRYQQLQAMEPPSIETHSRSASMPQLSPHPQLVQSTDPNEGRAPSVVNIYTSGERVPKGINVYLHLMIKLKTSRHGNYDWNQLLRPTSGQTTRSAVLYYWHCKGNQPGSHLRP